MSFIGLSVLLMVLWSGSLNANGCYTSIISFGDSLTDTGNLKEILTKSGIAHPCLLPPYGQSFFGEHMGRCSNGRLIIDFLAESLGLPFVPAFLQIKGNGIDNASKQGVNYAVAGATALRASFVESEWPEKSVINASLEVQLSWFKESLSYICYNASGCRNFMGRSLILMGEIGGNDYSSLLLVGKPVSEAKPYVTLITDTVVSAVNTFIEVGAQMLVVPGSLPIGCSSSYLTTRAFLNEEHDPITGCLIQLNELAEYQNKMLRTKLNQIRRIHPNVVIIYADYFNAAMQIYRSPEEFGFTNGALKACCGGGGPFNYNSTVRCGSEYSTVCDQPDTYFSWDGVHFTEAAYRVIFKNSFQGTYTTPKFRSVCPTLTLKVGLGLSSSM